LPTTIRTLIRWSGSVRAAIGWFAGHTSRLTIRRRGHRCHGDAWWNPYHAHERAWLKQAVMGMGGGSMSSYDPLAIIVTGSCLAWCAGMILHWVL
jgi:hypothetical protein